MKVRILAASAASAALLFPAIARAQQPAKPATITVQPASKAYTIYSDNMVLSHPQIASTVQAASDRLTTRVNLDMNNVPVRDALKQVSEQAKQEIVVDNDVPQDTRVTVRATNVQLNTALDLITQAAGVRWSSQRKDGKTSLRVGKSVFAITLTSPLVNYSTLAPTKVPQVLNNGLRLHGDGVFYTYSQNENRSTFTCPHCKRQATVIRKAEAAKCPKCKQVMQSNWQFCPNDGTKRPASETAWKFCPFCSRAVTMTEATR